jgi:hypothetical protein
VLDQDYEEDLRGVGELSWIYELAY